MKLQGLIDVINNSNISTDRDINVRVVVHSPGSLGSTPAVDVKQIAFGIDWDNNTLLIYTDDDLTRLTPEQVNEISESVSKGNSWHSYQSYKTQKKEIDDLKNELKQAKNFIKSLVLKELTDEQKIIYKTVCNDV